MVRAMVLTPLATQRSGIPPASSILASLGCKVLQVVRLALMCFRPRSNAGSDILTIHTTRATGPVACYRCSTAL